MKKQQKPNWFGGLLAMFILASAFLLTSQQVKEKLENEAIQEQEVALDSVVFTNGKATLKTPYKDSTRMVRFPMFHSNTTDSISYQYWKVLYFTNDSLTVEKALADILKNKGNFIIERLESGEITNVSKGKKELTGDSLTVYKQAFEMLDYLRSLEGGSDLSNEDFSKTRMELQMKRALSKIETLKAKSEEHSDPELEKVLNEATNTYQQQMRAMEKAQYQQQLALREKAETQLNRIQQGNLQKEQKARAIEELLNTLSQTLKYEQTEAERKETINFM